MMLRIEMLRDEADAAKLGTLGYLSVHPRTC